MTMLQVDADGKSDIGKVRQANQDAFTLDRERQIYVVADGMGGHTGGEIASQQAVDITLSMVRRLTSTDAVDGDGETTARPKTVAPAPPEQQLVEAIQAANAHVFRLAAEDRKLHGMGTTLVALYLNGSSAHVGSVGDSRVYLWRNHQLRQVTHDHSLVNEYVRLGTLSAEEASTHPLKHIISRAIGVHPTVEVDHFAVALKPDDLFLLCSDGLTNMLDPNELAAILTSVGGDASAVCRELIQRANAKGGLDNITAVVVRCLSM
jgi:serine/threonine protein phosphatase PrpC